MPEFKDTFELDPRYWEQEDRDRHAYLLETRPGYKDQNEAGQKAYRDFLKTRHTEERAQAMARETAERFPVLKAIGDVGLAVPSPAGMGSIAALLARAGLRGGGAFPGVMTAGKAFGRWAQGASERVGLSAVGGMVGGGAEAAIKGEPLGEGVTGGLQTGLIQAPVEAVMGAGRGVMAAGRGIKKVYEGRRAKQAFEDASKAFHEREAERAVVRGERAELRATHEEEVTEAKAAAERLNTRAEFDASLASKQAQQSALHEIGAKSPALKTEIGRIRDAHVDWSDSRIMNELGQRGPRVLGDEKEVGISLIEDRLHMEPDARTGKTWLRWLNDKYTAARRGKEFGKAERIEANIYKRLEESGDANVAGMFKEIQGSYKKGMGYLEPVRKGAAFTELGDWDPAYLQTLLADPTKRKVLEGRLGEDTVAELAATVGLKPSEYGKRGFPFPTTARPPTLPAQPIPPPQQSPEWPSTMPAKIPAPVKPNLPINYIETPQGIWYIPWRYRLGLGGALNVGRLGKLGAEMPKKRGVPESATGALMQGLLSGVDREQHP